MKKFIFLVLLLFLVKPVDLIALDTPPKTNKEIVESLVDKYSREYGVSRSSLMKTILNENRQLIFDQQSNLTYKAGNLWGFPAGTREKSYGICQIHLPSHPSISYEQAIDPEFCIRFMAEQFSKGNQKMWMGYEKG